MKKTLVKAASVALCFVLLSLCAFSNLSAQESSNTSTISAPSAQNIMETRFLNILNHNQVYGEDFSDLETIVNNSAVALLQYAEDSFLRQDIMEEYLLNMYDLVIDDYSILNKDFPQNDGYLFVLPRGYCEYKHSPVSITENEDGTFTFVTDVTVDTHDGEKEVKSCKTLFVKNENSVFGYNIVVSEIL